MEKAFFGLAPCVLILQQPSKFMATKKTAKTIPESAPKKAAAAPKPAAKKAAKKAAVKKAAPAASTVKAPVPAAAKKAPAKKAAAKPSLDSVARAAYLNYRNRVEKGLPGDSHGDWLEAERQQSALG
jgi:hypothetical protein